LGGTLPASVLVLPVIDPTITILGLAEPLFALGALSRSSSSSLQSRKWPRWLVPTESSKPSAVKRGSLAVGRYTAALATSASRRRPDARSASTNARTESSDARSRCTIEYESRGSPAARAAASALEKSRTAMTTCQSPA
jgi:hypothetical protein